MADRNPRTGDGAGPDRSTDADNQFCDRCGETHRTATDADGYTLMFCPTRGTVLVERPAGLRGGGA